MRDEKLTSQVKFWALIGPFISLSTLLLLFFKSSAVIFFLAYILLFGVAFCWKWKLWGFTFSVALLVSLLAYHYHGIPLEERFWYLGMGLSISIALFITALSFEEVEALVVDLQVESGSRLENLWKVDEKQKNTEKLLQQRESELQELRSKVRSYQKFVDMSTEELLESKAKYRRVLEELNQIK